MGAHGPSQANGWLAKASLCSHSLFKAAAHLGGVLPRKFGVRGAASANPSTPSKGNYKSEHIFEDKRHDQPTHFHSNNLQQRRRLAVTKTVVLSPAASPINT